MFGRYGGEVTDIFNSGKGYAFVTMTDENAAKAAIRELNGTKIGGRDIKVSLLAECPVRSGPEFLLAVLTMYANGCGKKLNQ